MDLEGDRHPMARSFIVEAGFMAAANGQGTFIKEGRGYNLPVFEEDPEYRLLNLPQSAPRKYFDFGALRYQRWEKSHGGRKVRDVRDRAQIVVR
jgi:hypothetical protein